MRKVLPPLISMLALCIGTSAAQAAPVGALWLAAAPVDIAHARACGTVRVATSPPQRMVVSVTGDYTCARARTIIRASVQPGPLPLPCSNRPGQRPRRIVCAGRDSSTNRFSRIVAVRA